MIPMTPEKVLRRISSDGSFYGELVLGGYDHPLPENLKVLSGDLSATGYKYALPDSMTRVAGNLDVSSYDHPLPSELSVVDGDIVMEDYGFPLPESLSRVAGSVDLSSHDFYLPSQLEFIGGTLYLGGYQHPLPLGLREIGGLSLFGGYEHPLPEELRIRGEVTGAWGYRFPFPKGYKKDHYKMTTPQTEGFRNWFDGSKVLTLTGDPLVVYHGTEDGGFSAFDAAKIDPHHPGFYFSNDISVAGTYIHKPLWPLEDPTPALGIKDDEGRAGVYRLYLNLKNPAIIDCKEKNWDRIDHPDFPGLHRTYEIAAEAKRRGYDGVIFENIIDHGQASGFPRLGNVYVAFEPTQIKSALFNTGSFSKTDPDIRKNPRRTSRRSIRKPSPRAKTSRGR